jgi:hypothetical protein
VLIFSSAMLQMTLVYAILPKIYLARLDTDINASSTSAATSTGKFASTFSANGAIPLPTPTVSSSTARLLLLVQTQVLNVCCTRESTLLCHDSLSFEADTFTVPSIAKAMTLSSCAIQETYGSDQSTGTTRPRASSAIGLISRLLSLAKQTPPQVQTLLLQSTVTIAATR